MANDSIFRLLLLVYWLIVQYRPLVSTHVEAFFHLNFRLILLSWPLHYKRLVTKRRIHIAFSSTFTILAMELAFAFICFRQEGFLERKECRIDYVLQEIVFLTIPFLLFLIFTVIIITCHCVITLKLIKRAKLFGTSNGDDHSKLMKASWIVSSLYIILYIPSAIISLTHLFVGDSYTWYVLILQDICGLIFFLNNVVNPFIYCLTLKHFREGYTSFLTCGKRSEG